MYPIDRDAKKIASGANAPPTPARWQRRKRRRSEFGSGDTGWSAILVSS